ncbi:hypothetical protein PTKIN_Ptkin19aG0071800 [Pterospermum kingtungense]
MSSMENEQIMYSTEEEDQSPEEKRQKLEKDDDFHIPHYDRETYYKKLYDFSTIMEGDDCIEDEDRDFTEEEAKLYYDALEATDVRI